MHMMTEKKSTWDLKSMTPEELQERLSQMGEKAFRAKQVYQWIHEKLVSDYDEMSNLSKELREKLDGIKVEIKVKTGANGKFFGSVTNNEVADKLCELGFEIDKNTFFVFFDNLIENLIFFFCTATGKVTCNNDSINIWIFAVFSVIIHVMK